MNRRYFLSAGVAAIAVAAISRLSIGSIPFFSSGQGPQKTTKEKLTNSKGITKVTKTNEEWKKELTPEQYYVTREREQSGRFRAR